jgi:hypothetical protein
MRSRVARGLIALTTVLALLMAVPASTANAETKQVGDRVCNMYANSNGFGAYCSSGEVGYKPRPWRDRLPPGGVFVSCRDYDIPAGIELPAPPDGKTWKLRLTIVDYDLNTNNPPGGPKAHLERAIVPVSQAEQEQCPVFSYMDNFWTSFSQGYPDPVLVVNPTFTPRVNVPAYFDLSPDSAYILKNTNIARYGTTSQGTSDNLTMRGVVGRLLVDPGDGTPPFNCLTGVTPIGKEGYDKTKDPFHQDSMCKHVYKRSSAKEPDGMYTVKLTIYWDVAYWTVETNEWKWIGRYPVTAVQRLPVQEVQTIGG